MKQDRPVPPDRRTDITHAVVERAHQLANSPLSAGVAALAKQCILDWIGVALVGSREPSSQILLAQALEDQGGNAPGPASCVGSGRKLSVRAAALINGTAGHALDYDDLHIAAQGHVTAAVLPAALAVAEARQASGGSLLHAFVAGYESAGMVGQYVGRAHYDRGFHGTSTVGSYGAACAAAVLLKLDSRSTAVALGISGTQAGGMKAQFGTMCKPLHAGKASENGVVGAQLALRGFSGRVDLLEAPQGFAAAMSPVADAASALAPAQGGSHLYGNLFKYHAACYGTHAALEAVLKLCREYDLGSEDIFAVTLEVEPGADRMCNIQEPVTGLQTKFSLRFNAALAILGEDTASPDTYSDANAARSDLCALRELVTVHLMPDGWPLMVSAARIETRDGRNLYLKYDSSVPESDIDLQGARVRHKFMALAKPILGEERAATVMDEVHRLEHMDDIGRLMSLIR